MTLVDDTVASDDGTGVPGLSRADDGLVSVAELARRNGVSRQAVHKQVKQLERDGVLSVVRRGRSVLVDPIKFAAARAATGDPARGLAKPLAHDGGNPPDNSFHAHKADLARYDAELKSIKLKQLRGELVEVAELEDALAECGARLGRHFDMLAGFAEELTAIAVKDGAGKVRTYLKDKARKARQAMADEMVKVAQSAGAGVDDEDV